MARILTPMGSAGVSGSIGGTTYARNRYGTYIRTKATPVNPNSGFQNSIRSKFSSLCAAWGLLTSAQRLAWETYAGNTPMTDVFGQPMWHTGRNWFIGNNTLRLQAGLSVVSDGPTTFGLPGLTLPVPAFTEGDPISVAFTNTDDWAGEVGGALLLFATDAKPATVNFCKGPYRYAGKVAGAGTPPTTPATIAAPFAYVEGQRVFWRAVALTADGRVSADSYGNSFCAA